MIRAVLFLFFLESAAFAGVPEWVSGRAILDQYEAVGPGRDIRRDLPGSDGTLQSAFTLYGSARPKLTETIGGQVALRGSAFRRSLEKGKTAILRGDVKELWVERDHAGLRLQLGQIITSWGRSDAVNPTDFLTSKDFTYLSGHDEVRRQGAPGFRATYVPAEGTSPLEFSFAWNARYPQSKLLIPSAQIPAGLAVDAEPTPPKYFGDNEEFALKLGYLAPAWDASLSFFDGRTHFGQFVWDGGHVALEYLKVQAIGGDFSVTFNDFVLRGESAYFFYETGKSGLADASITEPNHWDSVLGAERALGERFRVIAQALYRVHPSLRDSQAYVGSNSIETAIVRGVGRANATIQNYRDHSKWGATLLVRYVSPDEFWNGEFAAIGNFVGGDYILHPKLERKISGSLRLAFGLDYYGGPTDQPLGSLRDYRSAYLEGSMTF